MEKKARKDWDDILGKTPIKEEVLEVNEFLYFDLRELIKSIICLISIIIVLIMFLVNYFPSKEILFHDVYGKYLPSIIMAIVILIFYAKPFFKFIISFMDDDFGFILVPIFLILSLPFLLIILFIFYTTKSIKNCLRPKL